MTWRVLSSSIESRGSTSKPAHSLADLHRRRAETKSQYFTPAWVACGIWSSLSEIVTAELKREGHKLSVCDTSIGTAALLEGAPVEQIAIYGVDTDGRCIDALSTDANNADLDFEFINSGLEEMRIKNFSIAILNSPYSLQLNSPLLTPYACTHYGRFGPGTSAISHEYALDQALVGADVVAAVLPDSADELCQARKGLVMKVRLPGNAFEAEGANVKTAVYFFAKRHESSDVRTVSIREGESWPVLSGSRVRTSFRVAPTFRKIGIEETEPVITLPVTGDARVGLHHHGRRVVLSFACGLTQARVQNHLLRKKAEGKRLPRNIIFQGDGALSLDVMLLQDNPQYQLSILAKKIATARGIPVISETLSGYYRKLLRRHQRAIVPMRRVIQTTKKMCCKLVASQRTQLIPNDFTSPSIAKGETLDAFVAGGEYRINHKGVSVTLRSDEVMSRYDLVEQESREAEWVVLHEGLCVAFPQITAHYSSVLDRAGITWLADFQRHSAIEGLVKPSGFIAAHEQGAGKTRFSLALALVHSGRSMIVVESGLLPELLREVKKLGISDSLWTVLKNNDDVSAKINITTYNTLRRVADNGKTNAKRGEEESIY